MVFNKRLTNKAQHHYQTANYRIYVEHKTADRCGIWDMKSKITTCFDVNDKCTI